MTPFSAYPDLELLLFTDELKLTTVPAVDSYDTKSKPLPGNSQKQRLSYATTPPVRNVQFSINALFRVKLLTHCGNKYMYYKSYHVFIAILPCTYSTNKIGLRVDLYSLASTPTTCTFVSTVYTCLKPKSSNWKTVLFCDAWSSGRYRNQRSVRQELCVESASHAFLLMLQPVPQSHQKLPVGRCRTI
jgi:hypothetical protein